MFETLSPPYNTLVIDPPWHYDERVISYGHNAPTVLKDMPYSTMSNDEIAAMPVIDLAAANAHLYLWTTNQHIWAAREIAMGWGFEPVQVLVWCKPPSGLGPGGLYANTTEFILYCRRYHGGGPRLVTRAGKQIMEARVAAGIGRPELHVLVRGGSPTGIVTRWENDDSLPNTTDWAKLCEVLPDLSGINREDMQPERPKDLGRVDSSWWEWKRARHSAKPEQFQDLVEQVSPGPYVELFARRQRLGWDVWGWGVDGVEAS